MLVKIFLFLSLCQGLLFSQTSESQNQPTPTPQKTPVKRKQPSGPINPQNPGGAQEKGAGEINPNNMGGAQANPGSVGGVSDTGAGATSGVSAGATSNSSTAGSVSGTAGNASAEASNATGTIAAGTEIRIMLDTPLSSKTSHKGDLFSATLEEPLRASNGELVIPAGSRVEGEITAAEAENTDSSKKRGRLYLRFNYLVLPTGNIFSLTANLVAINSPGSRSQNAMNASNNGSTAASKKSKQTSDMHAEAGAAVGAFSGRRQGDARGVVGSVNRSSMVQDSYVVAIQGKGVELPAGTVMVLLLKGIKLQ